MVLRTAQAFTICFLLISSTLARAQVLEIDEDGAVRPAPGITGKSWSPGDTQLVIPHGGTAPPPPAGANAASVGSEAAPRPSMSVSELAASSGGDWVVQLGAYPNLRLLDDDWRRIKEKHPGLLSPYLIASTEVMIGSRRHIRLSAVGLRDVRAALSLCEVLSGQGTACFVRKAEQERTLVAR